MKEYTAKEMKVLKANPYTFKVTKNKLYCTLNQITVLNNNERPPVILLA